MKTENVRQSTTGEPKKRLPTDIILPELEGKNVRVVEFGMGVVIIATHPWALEYYGVPQLRWIITTPNSPHKHSLYGRVVYAPEVGSGSQYRGVHNSQQPNTQYKIAGGWVDNDYYGEVLNKFVIDLLDGDYVEGYVTNYKGVKASVELEGLTPLMISRLTSGLVDGSVERVYIEALSLLGVDVYKGDGGVFSPPSVTSRDFDPRDVMRSSSPAILEQMALLNGIKLTDYRLG